MASSINDVQAAITAVQQSVTQLDTDIQALVAKGAVDLDPVVAALGALNTALTTLDASVKTALGQ